jgi:integrative and conjugative element protein (TIGR02256 family)
VVRNFRGTHFDRCDGGAVKIADGALQDFARFAQTSSSSKEAGGVLIGRHILNSKDIVVDAVTTPLPGDRRTRTSYHRHAAGHQEILDRAWAASRGTSVYLGEWHTHPEPTPSPSQIDLKDWNRRLRADIVEAPFILFVIVGQKHVCAWLGDRQTLRLKSLSSR